MQDHKAVDCPLCGSNIYIQPQQLLQGVSFSCSNPECNAAISLNQSSYAVTNHALNELEKIKKIQLNA